MSEPLLSIITINFNNKNGLQKTMDSVLNQSFQDYEYIIIDGGSSDGSKELIEAYSSKDDFKKHVAYWCSEKDSGIYNAMNKGIRHASGNWVYMLNSGDALVNDALNSVSDVLHSHENEVVYGAIDCYADNEYTWTSCHSAKKLDAGMFPHQGFFSPRIFHEKYGFYDESFKIAADWDYALRLKDKGCIFYHVPLIIAEYDETGISATMTPLHKKEIKLVQERHNIVVTKPNLFKKVLKLFVPPILILIARRILKK